MLAPLDALLVYCSFGDSDEACAVAKTLVSEKLAACVSLVPAKSHYQWEGVMCSDDELVATIKTSRSRFPALRARIRELHSYDCPEILGVPVVVGDEEYLRWLQKETQPPSAPKA